MVGICLNFKGFFIHKIDEKKNRKRKNKINMIFFALLITCKGEFVICWNISRKILNKKQIVSWEGDDDDQQIKIRLIVTVIFVINSDPNNS